MNKIIAILVASGQFHVAVETSAGYEEASFPNTEKGVEAFSSFAAPILKRETSPYRFCLTSAESDGYGEIDHQLMLNGYGPSSLTTASFKEYLAKNPGAPLSGRTAAKACLSAFPFLRTLRF
jgi:hypothetical protein